VLEIHPVLDDERAAVLAAKIAKGKKSLFFTDSRGACERMRTALTDFGVQAYVHHSSVSRALREEAEAAFRAGRPARIACTSSMELGLDVGDLDLVMQLGAPSTVSAFLQRLGRTGRRADAKGHFVFLTDEEWQFVQACALVFLAFRGQVEDSSPRGGRRTCSSSRFSLACWPRAEFLGRDSSLASASRIASLASAPTTARNWSTISWPGTSSLRSVVS
jgi:ATP-dependent Lhr-like helicase